MPKDEFYNVNISVSKGRRNDFEGRDLTFNVIGTWEQIKPIMDAVAAVMPDLVSNFNSPETRKTVWKDLEDLEDPD